jgi:phosphate/sulfate permease
MLFHVTAAVSVLSSVPYMNRTVAAVLGSWILLSPILALVLALAGALVMHRELSAFSKIKAAFRAVQSRVSSVSYNERSRFTIYLLVYMYSLSACAAANIYVASKIWLPVVRVAG